MKALRCSSCLSLLLAPAAVPPARAQTTVPKPADPDGMDATSQYYAAFKN